VPSLIHHPGTLTSSQTFSAGAAMKMSRSMVSLTLHPLLVGQQRLADPDRLCGAVTQLV
jgi:hypothetical protein